MKNIAPLATALCAFGCCLAVGLPAFASAPTGFELRPGVVADARGEILYLMQPDGGIAALDVESGRELWTTDAAARPLYADDEVLVAQVETPGRYGMLNLAVFDVRTPETTPALAAIEMPAGTQALVVASPRSTFDLWARRSGDAVLVGWTYTTFEKTAVESASRNAAARGSTSGAARIPLGRGSIRVLEAAEAPDPKRASLPDGDVPVLDGFNTEMIATAVGGGVRHAGNKLVLVDLPDRDPRQAARVRRWEADGGRSLGEIQVFGDGRLVKNLSADGRFLLGSALAIGDPVSPRYDWTLVDLATGQPVAAFRHADPAASFFLTADRIVVDVAARGRQAGGEWIWQPLTVQGLDRTSGQVRWSRPVRDMAYTGDLPPTPPTR